MQQGEACKCSLQMQLLLLSSADGRCHLSDLSCNLLLLLSRDPGLPSARRCAENCSTGIHSPWPDALPADTCTFLFLLRRLLAVHAAVEARPRGCCCSAGGLCAAFCQLCRDLRDVDPDLPAEAWPPEEPDEVVMVFKGGPHLSAKSPRRAILFYGV